MIPQYPVDQRLESARPERILPDSLIPERSGVTVWWSNIVRNGEWLVPRLFRVFTCMGNVQLDLTTARMGPGTSEIEIWCIMANVEITVPRDIRVLCDGEGFVGNFEVVRIGETTPPVDAPTLRVSGNAYLGSVSVKIVGTVGPGFMERLKAGWQSINS